MAKEELSKGFTGIEINGVRFSNIKEMLIYMNKQRVRIINLEKENAELKAMNGYHKSAVLKTPIKKVNYDTIHKRIQRTGNFIV